MEELTGKHTADLNFKYMILILVMSEFYVGNRILSRIVLMY